MVCITSFSTVRSENKSVLHDDMPLKLNRWNVQYNRLTEASHPSPSVQTRHICKHVINPEDLFKDVFFGMYQICTHQYEYGGDWGRSQSFGYGNFLCILLSILDSSSTVSNPTTRCKNTCNSGWDLGSFVTSNNGLNKSEHLINTDAMQNITENKYWWRYLQMSGQIH